MTKVKKLAHPNVMKALREFGTYIREAPNATAARRAELYHEAVCCADLMNYSYEVADTSHPAWNLLWRRVDQLLCLIAQQAKP